MSKTLIQTDSDIHIIVLDHKHSLRTHSNIGLGDLNQYQSHSVFWDVTNIWGHP